MQDGKQESGLQKVRNRYMRTETQSRQESSVKLVLHTVLNLQPLLHLQASLGLNFLPPNHTYSLLILIFQYNFLSGPFSSCPKELIMAAVPLTLPHVA